MVLDHSMHDGVSQFIHDSHRTHDSYKTHEMIINLVMLYVGSQEIINLVML